MELCQNAGVRLEFLPPYSPDFNPIEEAFAELKAWMRKNNALASSFDDFEDFLQAEMSTRRREATRASWTHNSPRLTHPCFASYELGVLLASPRLARVDKSLKSPRPIRGEAILHTIRLVPRASSVRYITVT